MADTKITALTENTAPIATDIFVMVDDPGGTPATQKVTRTSLKNLIGVTAPIMETATSTTEFVTPLGQPKHPASCKFWVRWTGNSTTILSSYNVTSIADTNVGDADITLTTVFSATSWAGFVNTLDATNGWDDQEMERSGFNAIAAGTAGVLCSVITDGNTAVCSLTDPDSWNAFGFGDQ
jgi:hypothetical protein